MTSARATARNGPSILAVVGVASAVLDFCKCPALRNRNAKPRRVHVVRE